MALIKSLHFLYIGITHILCETISCNSQYQTHCGPCYASQNCQLSCTGKESCRGPNMRIACNNNPFCSIICDGSKACVESTVFIQDVDLAILQCLSQEDCQSVTLYSSATHLTVNCIGSDHNCQHININAELSQSVTINCDGSYACKQATIICGSDDCIINCNSTHGDVCKGLDLVCGSGECQIDCTSYDGYDNCDSITVDKSAASHFTCIGSVYECRFAHDPFTIIPTAIPTKTPITTLSPTLLLIDTISPTIEPTTHPTDVLITIMPSTQPTTKPSTTQIPAIEATVTQIHTTIERMTEIDTTQQRYIVQTSNATEVHTTAANELSATYANEERVIETTIYHPQTFAAADKGNSISVEYVRKDLDGWVYIIIAIVTMLCGLTASFGIMKYKKSRTQKICKVQLTLQYIHKQYAYRTSIGEISHELDIDEGVLWNTCNEEEDEEKDELDVIHNTVAHDDDDIVDGINDLTATTKGDHFDLDVTIADLSVD